MKQTIPEIVTKYNIERLKKTVKNGKDKYPGANFVFKNIGERRIQKYLGFSKEQIDQIGDVVERHLIDDDIVLFNRQPTLQKQSMMAHRAGVCRDPNISSFGLNVCVTTPYNADFDGDEMNKSTPQGLRSIIELKN